MDTEGIKTIIKDLLNSLNVSVTDIEINKQGELVVYNVLTPESGMIIGKGGEHLKALNYLLGHIVSRKAGYFVKFNIDVNGYRQNEANEIMAEARKIAEDVMKTKNPIEMRPMTSYERMLIHNMFSEDIRIETSSVGEGEERRVVIKYSEI